MGAERADGGLSHLQMLCREAAVVADEDPDAPPPEDPVEALRNLFADIRGDPPEVKLGLRNAVEKIWNRRGDMSCSICLPRS